MKKDPSFQLSHLDLTDTDVRDKEITIVGGTGAGNEMPVLDAAMRLTQVSVFGLYPA